MTPNDIREQIELSVVEFIKKSQAEGTLSDERSQAISERVLELLRPGMSFEELYKEAIPRLDDTAPELSPIITPYLKEYEENIVKAARQSVSDLIKVGQYDDAVKVANQAINQDVKLAWQGSGKATKDQP